MKKEDELILKTLKAKYYDEFARNIGINTSCEATFSDDGYVIHSETKTVITLDIVDFLKFLGFQNKNSENLEINIIKLKGVECKLTENNEEIYHLA